ncbi:RNA-guided endonuclease TnpB family protein [Nocardia sp. NPDC050718]|uniref:RNA-guided endonuclease InsQ/TnpB family protein n=1 Tax=Nocardia sp. NPDC050718 TaxID=3155788 RepID=UPI0033DB6F6D
MLLRYLFRVYPTPGQQIALARAFGCSRVVFNDSLRLRRQARAAGTSLSDTEIQKCVVTEAKRTSERAWLAEVSAVVLVQACQDARAAYRNWIASLSGKRRGPRIGAPRFRSRKDSRQTIRLTRNGFSLRPNGRLYVAKIGDIAVRWSRSLPSDPSSVTIVRDSSGRYFASFVVTTSDGPLPACASEVGIDLGLANFAVLSDGSTIESPRFFRQAERRLRRAHQHLSRKMKGSLNRAKARVRLAKAYAKVRDARRDWAHKVSTKIVRENQAVYVEDLCVRGLARTAIGKSVHDAGWAVFTRMLMDKAERFGRTFIKVDRCPSSQLCSMCGLLDGPKRLDVRKWTCGSCGVTHDRDLNAAKNILAAGRAERLNACGGAVSLSA